MNKSCDLLGRSFLGDKRRQGMPINAAAAAGMPEEGSAVARLLLNGANKARPFVLKPGKRRLGSSFPIIGFSDSKRRSFRFIKNPKNRTKNVETMVVIDLQLQPIT